MDPTWKFIGTCFYAVICYVYILEIHQFRVLEIKSYFLNDARWTRSNAAKVYFKIYRWFEFCLSLTCFFLCVNLSLTICFVFERLLRLKIFLYNIYILCWNLNIWYIIIYSLAYFSTWKMPPSFPYSMCRSISLSLSLLTVIISIFHLSFVAIFQAFMIENFDGMLKMYCFIR